MGRKFKKDEIYARVWLIHLAAQQKLTQYCNATKKNIFFFSKTREKKEFEKTTKAEDHSDLPDTLLRNRSKIPM